MKGFLILLCFIQLSYSNALPQLLDQPLPEGLDKEEFSMNGDMIIPKVLFSNEKQRDHFFIT
jgi:hypothetical protein